MSFLSKWFAPRKSVMPLHVADVAAFERDVLGSATPVIVDVWSEGCAPCRQLAPVLVDVATRYEGRVRVVDIDAGEDPALMRRLGVRATPTILVFRGGRELGRVAGYHPRNWFDEMIEAEFPDEGASA